MPGDSNEPPRDHERWQAHASRGRPAPMISATLFWVFWGLFALVTAFLVFVGVQYLARGNPIQRIRLMDDRKDVPAASDPGFSRLVEAHVGTSLEPGNHIDILFDGDEFYPRFFEDIRNARDLITWHVFWFKPGSLADQVHEILVERARAGVRVLLIYDYLGAWGIEDEYWDGLRDAGCEVHPFRPLRWNQLYKWQKRSHIRAVTIDGMVGYTGGFAIHDDWLGDGRHPGQWRDTSVRIDGPIVRRLQTAFVTDWSEATGELLLGPSLFPEASTNGGPHRAGLLFNAPSSGSTDAERYFAISIDSARETLYITNPYFIPDDDFRRMLVEAVERGVDVRVLTPGRNNDHLSTYHAGRCHFQQLLDAGVRIWEYEPTMVHAKTLVADAAWCSVGTINFDNRSMSLNEEVALLAQDEDLGTTLHERFLEDLEHATELDPDAFRKRGLRDRAKERFWVLFSRIL